MASMFIPPGSHLPTQDGFEEHSDVEVLANCYIFGKPWNP